MMFDKGVKIVAVRFLRSHSGTGISVEQHCGLSLSYRTDKYKIYNDETLTLARLMFFSACSAAPRVTQFVAGKCFPSCFNINVKENGILENNNSYFAGIIGANIIMVGKF